MAIKRILVPLDGSSLAEHALPYAMTLARRLDARLELARAVFPSLGFLAEPSSEEIETAECERFALEAVARQLLAAGLRVGCHVGCGRPAPVLIEMVSRVNAGLVVMSTHGRPSGGRWSYGGVADEILRTAPVPVLLVSTVCERTWPNDQIRRILLPLDDSSLADESLEPASELALAAGAELLLIQIVEISVVTEAAPYLLDPEAELARAREYLDRIADRMKASGLAVTSYSAVGDPSATLALIAREGDADLIAMATHGRSGLTHLLLGSVATGTVRQSTVPVLLSRPAALCSAVIVPSAP